MSDLGFDTLKAIALFRSGTTPLDAVEYLNVGREDWHEGTTWYLDTFVSGGRSAVRFVQGEYGEGKTHFLYLTAKAALDRNFAVSYVTAERARLDKFDSVYRQLVNSLRTKRLVEEEGLDFSAETNGLKRILDEWYREIRVEAEGSVEDRIVQGAKVTQRIRERILSLDEKKEWDANFRNAVQHYLLNLLASTPEGDEQNSRILSWLQGQPLPKAEMRDFEAYEAVKADNSRDMVRSLILMLRGMGYAGLVALFDELERILEQAPKARGKAYQTVRQLLDNADRAGTTWCYMLCAITGEVLTSEKGFREYDALWERVRTDIAPRDGKIDKRAIIINLELTPFGEPELTALARKVRAIHADAMNWDAEARITDEVISEYVKRLLPGELTLAVSAPRVLVRTLAQILEKAEQHPEFDPSSNVMGEIGEAVQSLEDERTTEIWD